MSKLTFREMEIFIQDISALMRTGVPVPDGLREMARNSDNSRLKMLSEEVAEATGRGVPLHEALAGSTVQVPRSLLAVFECMELSGESGVLLEFSAAHARRIRMHRSAMITAATYPLMVAFGILVLLWFLGTFVLPRFMGIFSQLGAELPALTALIMNVLPVLFSGVVGTTICLAVLLLILLLVFNESSRDHVFDFISGFPFYGRLIAMSDTAMLMKYLGVMLTRGVPLATALEAASLAVSLPSSRTSIQEMSLAAERGNPVSEYLNPLFPATAVHLFRQGEENGRLAEVCTGLGEWADSTFERQGRRVSGLLEPIALFVLLVTIGVIVISLYLPLFNFPRLVR